MATTTSSPLEDPHTRLDQLHSEEEKVHAEKDEMLEHLRKSTTSEEKKTIFEVVKTLNDTINSIKQERMKILDIMKTQLEKGRFSSYFTCSLLIYWIFSEKGAVASPSKKIRRSLPPPTTGSKWTFDILQAYAINFKKVYSIDELLFQAAPVVSGR